MDSNDDAHIVGYNQTCYINPADCYRLNFATLMEGKQAAPPSTGCVTHPLLARQSQRDNNRGIKMTLFFFPGAVDSVASCHVVLLCFVCCGCFPPWVMSNCKTERRFFTWHHTTVSVMWCLFWPHHQALCTVCAETCPCDAVLLFCIVRHFSVSWTNTRIRQG